jgi:hypothetical protein
MERAHTGTSERRVVARGSLRVDARRAAAQLRQHLLLDLHDYSLEVVRAAVASGAGSIDVSHDADDVVFEWAGDPLPEPSLARLLDHVLGEARDDAGRRQRLLALAVNAALGLGPAFVDVVRADAPDGEAARCRRVRWTPAMLAQASAAGDAASGPEITDVPAPAGMPRPGTRLQVRHRLGWAVIRRALSSELPRELVSLGEATAELGAELRLRGATFPRPPRPRTLVEARFHVAGASRALLQITEGGAPSLELHEHGVRLAAPRWEPPAGFPSAWYADTELPVRVIVDAVVLPTNASRSAVRSDDPFVVEALAQSATAFERALEALVGRAGGDGVGGAPDPAFPVSFPCDDDALLEGALGRILCVVVGGARAGMELSPLARRLLELGLLRDGCGRPRSFLSLPGALAPPLAPDAPPADLARRTVYVWRGKAPLAAELASAGAHAVWLRGRPAERALVELPFAEVEPLVALARQGNERRARLLAHPPQPVALPASERYLARTSFEQKLEPSTALRGELALVSAPPGTRGPELRIFVEEREIGIERVEPDAVPFALDAAIAWSGLRVRLGWDGVEHDAALAAATHAVVRVAIGEARRLAKDWQSLDERSRSALRPVVRGAIAAAACGWRALGLPETQRIAVDSGDTLARAEVWPTTEPGRHASLRELRAFAARTGALCVAAPGHAGAAPDERPVLCLAERELGWLAQAVALPLECVPYDRALADSDAARAAWWGGLVVAFEAQQRTHDALGAPAMRFERDSIRGLVAVSTQPWTLVMHAGALLSSARASRLFGPVLCALDDPSAVPTADWTTVRSRDWGRGSRAEREKLELELLGVVVAALEGDAAARSRLSGTLPRAAHEAEPTLVAYLLESAAALRLRLHEQPRQSGDEALAELEARLAALPFLLVLDDGGRPEPASLGAVEQAHPAPAPLPVVVVEPSFETLDWRPVLGASPVAQAALRHWSGGRVALAGPAEIKQREERARDERARRTLLGRREIDPAERSPLADARSPVVRWVAPPGDDGSRSEATGALTGYGSHLVVDVLFRRRPLCQQPFENVPLPIVVRLSVVDPRHVAGWRALSDEGKRFAEATALGLARQLAFEIVQRAREAPSELFESASALALLAELVGVSADGERPSDDPGVEELLARLGRLVGRPEEASSSRKRTGAKRDRSFLASALADERLRWPAAQGGSYPLDALLRQEGRLGCARTRFASWRLGKRSSSELDRPVLYLAPGPAGDALERLLTALGEEPIDVGSALHKLQARRSVGDEPPRLSGPVAHPAMRVGVDTLGTRGAEGEIEIAPGPASEVVMHELGGGTRELPWSFVVPVRAAVRLDALVTEKTVAALVADLERASVRLLQSLVGQLTLLPPYVRHHLRRLACHTLGRGGAVTKSVRLAPVFLDTKGDWHALAALEERAEAEGGKPRALDFTTDPSLEPELEPGEMVLRLAEDEATPLGRSLKLNDATRRLRNELAGRERARAPQRTSVRLDAAERARCLLTVELRDREAREGEAGLLLPEHAGSKGIEISTTRRPLCRTTDGAGWPLIAVVNDEGLAPNRAFDGPRSPAASARLRSWVRAVAESALGRRLAPPADALAAAWIDTTRDKEPVLVCAPGTLAAGGPLAYGLPGARRARPSAAFGPLVVGAVWLPRTCRLPTVELRTSSASGAVALRAPVGTRGLDGRLPVAGTLLALPVPGADPAALTVGIAETVAPALAALVATAAAAASDGEIERYRWWITLVGCAGELERELRAPTADGGRVTAAEIVAELRRAGRLWYTSRRGSVAGRFPREQPAFVLLDAPECATPMTVLRERLAPEALLELGGLESEKPPLAVTAAIVVEPAPAASLEVLTPRVPIPSAPAPAPPPSRPSGETALLGALRDGLRALALTGDPVAEVRFEPGRRAVRYDAADRTVWLGRDNVAVKAATRVAPPAGLVAELAAAAVGEINRELTSVTDAEERRTLLALLEPSLTPAAPGAGSRVVRCR